MSAGARIPAAESATTSRILRLREGSIGWGQYPKPLVGGRLTPHRRNLRAPQASIGVETDARPPPPPAQAAVPAPPRGPRATAEGGSASRASRGAPHARLRRTGGPGAVLLRLRIRA